METATLVPLRTAGRGKGGRGTAPTDPALRRGGERDGIQDLEGRLVDLATDLRFQKDNHTYLPRGRGVVWVRGDARST